MLHPLLTSLAAILVSHVVVLSAVLALVAALIRRNDLAPGLRSGRRTARRRSAGVARSVPSPDAPDPVGGRTAPAVRRRGAGPSTTRRGPPPQPPRGRRADLRRDARGRPRRRRLRRGRGRRACGRRARPRSSTACASCSTRSGSRCCSATARGSSRSSTRSIAARRPTRSDPARSPIGDPSDVVRQRGPASDRARGDEPLAAADPRLLALPVRPGQPAARVRSRRRARVPPRPRVRRLDGLGARRDEDRRLVRYAGGDRRRRGA